MKTKPKQKKRLWLPFAVAAGVLVLLLLLAPVVAPAVGKWFTAQESAVRDGWAVDVGDLIGVDETEQVEIRHAPIEASITVLQLVPTDIEEEGFTYYDTGVQQRIRAMLERGQALSARGAEHRVEWTAETPLAVLDPFGTGANGLYLYFETDFPTQVEYTVHVDDERIPDYTATAADHSGREYTATHEFQLIGLVPGEVNEVTLRLRGSWGNLRQTVRFAIEMPETHSGYDTILEVTDGASAEPLDEGLFTMMRTNGYLGYGFLYDNSGVMRYEMVLEGFGMDRILFYGDEMVTCVSSNKLARINGLGEVEQVYPLGDYELHHDIDYGREGTVVALAEKAGDANVEDLVLEIDLATGEVTELLDFKDLMADYYAQTRPIRATDTFFWQVDEQDWIHLNTIQYLPGSDSLVVSSRETSTVIKVDDVHGEAAVGWLCGDPAFWQGTGYEGYCLAPVGDFTWQYGQHSVAWAEGEEEGIGYLRMFNNNYWTLSSRDGYDPDLPDGVSTELYGGADDRSYTYVYRVDENAGTVELVESFPVRYSSIVSNATLNEETGHWAVNSGISMLFGEYDADGQLIRQYAYQCTMQGYRTFKYDYQGFWFQ